MWETWVWSLGWEDPLEERMAVFLPGESPRQRRVVGYSPWGHKEPDTTEWPSTQKHYYCKLSSSPFISINISLLYIVRCSRIGRVSIYEYHILFSDWSLSVQFSSVTQSCPTLSATPRQASLSIIITWSSFKLMFIKSVMPSAIPSSVVPFSSCLQSLPASESFPMSQLFTWGGQSIGVSAWASVLPKNTQTWSPSEWTGWISLHSKGLSRVFSNTTVKKHQFFRAQLSSQSNSPVVHTWLLEKP